MARPHSVARQAVACACFLFALVSVVDAADKASFDDTARILAGMAPAAGSPLAKFTSDRSWQVHAKRFDQSWSQLDSRQLAKIRAWSSEHVTQRKPVVFYMFSGPDFLYADAFFPDANTYVLSALEPVGDIPNLDSISREALVGGLGRIEGSLNTVLSYSFFITKKMRHELSGGRFGGTLPILYVFLARSGKTITDVNLVALDADGKVVPDTSGLKSTAHGVKIDFTGKDGKAQSLYYFSTDLSDGGVKSSGFLKFCDGLGRGDSFLKSASYLMHSDNFSTIRSFIVDHSDTVVEDDSGIPLRFFKVDEWKFYPFGTYLQPLGIFPRTYQPQLSQLYRKEHAGNLDFGVGYRWRPRESNLLLAVRSGKRTAQGE